MEEVKDTPEARLKRYQYKPDSFIEVQDILVACLRENGVIKVVGGKGSYVDYCVAYSELIASCGNTISAMRATAMQPKESIIKSNKGGILSFARGRK